MGAAFAFSAGLLAYVYANGSTSAPQSAEPQILLCDMKSKRSPEMLGFLSAYRKAFGGFGMDC